MRDLEISRRLDAGAATPEDLRALAECPLARRAQYTGRILSLVENPDPEMRIAALGAIAGVRGVPGVRAITSRLDDEDDNVRRAALAALRVTARDAPTRYVHALFHPRVDVRRAALIDVPNGIASTAAYLRADPACEELARPAPWPDRKLPLVFDLFAMGRLPAIELVRLVAWTPPHELRPFLEREHGRTTAQIDAYLETVVTRPVAQAPGLDAIDHVVRAIAETGSFVRELQHLVVTVADKKARPLARRAIVSLLSHLARDPQPALWGAACALEPRLIEAACFDRAFADAAAAGLVRYAWPVKPHGEQVERMLALPWVQANLALASAISGLYPGRRLPRLAKVLGEHAILDSLVASDRGWVEICNLPQEKPPLDHRWLELILRTRPERHAQLAGIALGVHSGKRLESFIDQLPRRQRAPALLALAMRTQIAPEDPQLLTVAAMLASRVDAAGFGETLAELLAPTTGPRELAIALVLARALTQKLLTGAARSLPDALLLRVVTVIDGLDDSDALPRDRELALAAVAAERTHPVLVEWAARMMRVVTAGPAVPLPSVRPRQALTEDQQIAITTCSEADLELMLRPALIAPTTGLCAALERRAATPSVAACCALLGCADPIGDVAIQLDRFGERTKAFEEQLDNAAVALWRTGMGLPPLAHARQWRWEGHTAELATWVERGGGILQALRGVAALPGWLATSTLWRGISEVLIYARYRERTRFIREGTNDLAVFAANHVDTANGVHAARICVALVEGGAVPLPIIRKIVLDRTPDADAPTREQLARLIRLDGMPTPPRTVDTTLPAAALIATIKKCRDLDLLVTHCSDPRVAVVQEAVLVLATLGELGQLRLAGLVRQITTLAAPVPVLASIGLWDTPAALDVARSLAAQAELPPEWQFHLCLGLGDFERALVAAKAPGPSWFRRADWEALIKHVAPLDVALALVDCPHHHAYARAVELLLAEWGAPEITVALRRFIEVGTARPIDLRRSVARRLIVDAGDVIGVPILIDELIDDGLGATTWLDKTPASARPAGEMIARALADAALVGGHTACSEKRYWELLARLLLAKLVEPELLSELYARTLDDASTAPIRQAAAQLAVGTALAHARLVSVAEVFAWGVRRGVELTGRLFRFHMTSKERDLGHTYLDSSRIFVSALPMLRSEAHGHDVVEGLVLHEIGHHVYHRGEAALALWKKAHAEGIGHLLNLIADEHLERNLRAIDPLYGDRLKRLDAYAFQHAPQELNVESLLETLRGAAASALTGTELGVAYDEASVRLRRGAILGQLEKTGHPLARFARALRMGLGNRHEDPLVGAALGMCGKELRKLDMAGLYALTQQLAAMFGGSIAVARVFGGPEGLEFGERDDDVFGAGIDDEILQREVERILDPKRGKRGASREGPPRLQINVTPDEEFDRITNVRKVRGSPEEHRKLVGEVNRHSIRLRALLDDLGLRWLPVKARIKGHALDRSRLKALVTHGDPRILQARTPTRRTDLFLGTVIDCSGSMQAGQNIERARKFAVLIAEAVRPLPGVEARFFGFTDSVIYDAGDSADCGVTALQADGGNNDAAALFHVANVAAASRKRARVLVMISDGLPTECSVAALRGLVTTLTKRKGMVCAQVAVRRLEEECFPNYVVLDDSEIDVAVARFGRMIGDLARKVLSA